MTKRRRLLWLVVVPLLIAGLSTCLYYRSTATSPAPATVSRASAPTLTVNPNSGLYDPGYVNVQTPGAANLYTINNNTDFRLTVQWTVPDDTTGIQGYRVTWQYGSPSHIGPLFAPLTSDTTNSLVPATQTTFTFRPQPDLYAPCPGCTRTSNDQCMQIYVVSCASATDVSTCGMVPSTQTTIYNAMICYNPSEVYGYNPCCSCIQQHFCL